MTKWLFLYMRKMFEFIYKNFCFICFQENFPTFFLKSIVHNDFCDWILHEIVEFYYK